MQVVHETDIAASVRDAWQHVAPHLPYDPKRNWLDAGFDSLKMMELVLRLEHSLDVKISYDMLNQDLTVNDFVRALSGAAAAEDEGCATVFLVPGVFGDEPILARFRASLRQIVRFETLDLPEVDQPARILGSIDATAAFMVREILQRQPEGPLRVAGYSFGGLVAHTIARQLQAAGREVDFVCIIDGVLNTPRGTGPSDFDPSTAKVEAGPVPSPSRSVLGQVKHLFRRRAISDRDHVKFEICIRLHLYEAARRVLMGAAHRRSYHWFDVHRRRLLMRVRGWAIHHWQPECCDIPTVLFTSEDFGRFGSIVDWRALAPRLQVHAVPCAHTRIFDPPALSVVNPLFVAALMATAREHTAEV